MTKVAAVFFNKVFQTKDEVSPREKNIVVTVIFFISILIVGYFVVS